MLCCDINAKPVSFATKEKATVNLKTTGKKINYLLFPPILRILAMICLLLPRGTFLK